MRLSKLISCFAFLNCVISSNVVGSTLSHYQVPIFPDQFIDLPKQDRALIRDLKLINYPPEEWTREIPSFGTTPQYDVVIIGAGMAGLAAGAALYKEGIFNIKIFDQNPQGFEGPWITYARMKTLRSSKHLMGPALNIPHLTFHAWFEAQWGAEAWKELTKIPNGLWMEYLNWYRKVMQLPVENEYQLITILPMQDCIELEFQRHDGNYLIVKARKVILATGRSGFGGACIPSFVKDISKSLYAHTSECIDFAALKGRNIAIIGAGASAFDAAAIALEKGANKVDLIMRRKHLPNVNKYGNFSYKGFSLGFFKLSDEKRWAFMQIAFERGTPPPIEAIQRIEKHPNFSILPNRMICHIKHHESQIEIHTQQDKLNYDFLILSTGYYINGYQQPELRHLMDQIAVWSDRLPQNLVKLCPNMGNFPYLGPSFEFQPKEPGTAPYLRNLYCFNYSAILSHGLLTSTIFDISLGATRLAEGIAIDFFLQDSDYYLESLKNYEEEDFDLNILNGKEIHH